MKNETKNKIPNEKYKVPKDRKKNEVHKERKNMKHETTKHKETTKNEVHKE